MTSAALDALALLCERSPEGLGVSATVLQEEGIERSVLDELRDEGLVEELEDDGDRTVRITAAGRGVLTPRNSL